MKFIRQWDAERLYFDFSGLAWSMTLEDSARLVAEAEMLLKIAVPERLERERAKLRGEAN